MIYRNYSVLSSVYAKEKPEYLIQSIESMIHQTIVTDDYVIVKDGTLTRELDEILNVYAEKYEFIHIIGYKENRGLGAALNYGLKACKNELVARMDTDDIAVENRCEEQLHTFNNDPELEIVGTDIYEFTENEKNITGYKKMPSSSKDIIKYAHRRNPFNHPTVMYKKSSIFANGGYSEGQRGEDFELFTRMIFQEAKGYNINKPLVKYRAATDQYKRRASLIDTKAVVRVVKENYRNDYITLIDYLYVMVIQFAGLIVPKKIGNLLFKKIYREDYSKYDM